MKSDIMIGISQAFLSRPSRGAWIEIRVCCASAKAQPVAPLAGRVD